MTNSFPAQNNTLNLEAEFQKRNNTQIERRNE